MGRKERRLNKFSQGFNDIFNFFLLSYRAGIITFSGSEDFKVIYDPLGPIAKLCFKNFDNGEYTIKYENGNKSTKPIVTSQPNVLYAVIKGKKSWGLWIKEWASGIGEWCFTEEEILNEFISRNIEIPNSLLKDFQFVISKEKNKRCQ